jgi:hypothetical protein
MSPEHEESERSSKVISIAVIIAGMIILGISGTVSDLTIRLSPLVDFIIIRAVPGAILGLVGLVMGLHAFQYFRGVTQYGEERIERSDRVGSAVSNTVSMGLALVHGGAARFVALIVLGALLITVGLSRLVHNDRFRRWVFTFDIVLLLGFSLTLATAGVHDFVTGNKSDGLTLLVAAAFVLGSIWRRGNTPKRTTYALACYTDPDDATGGPREADSGRFIINDSTEWLIVVPSTTRKGAEWRISGDVSKFPFTVTGTGEKSCHITIFPSKAHPTRQIDFDLPRTSAAAITRRMKEWHYYDP